MLREKLKRSMMDYMSINEILAFILIVEAKP